MRGISICMQGSVTLFLKNMLFSIHFSHRKSTILLACDVSVFPCLHYSVLSFEGTQWISVSAFLTTFLQQGTLLASDSPQTVLCQNWKSKNPTFPSSVNEAESVFCSCQRWQMRFNLLVCYRSQNNLDWKELPEVSGPTTLSMVNFNIRSCC